MYNSYHSYGFCSYYNYYKENRPAMATITLSIIGTDL
jgi:hypothetical protein